MSPDDGEIAQQPVDGALLKREVRLCLLRMKKGEMFMDGLGEEELENLLDEDGNPPPPIEKNHVFNKMLKVVAKTIVGREQPDRKGSKKRRKTVEKQLQSFRDDWANEIRSFNPSEIEKELEEQLNEQDVAHDEPLQKPKKSKKPGPKQKQKPPTEEADEHYAMDTEKREVAKDTKRKLSKEAVDGPKKKKRKKQKQKKSSGSKRKQTEQEAVTNKTQTQRSSRIQTKKEEFEKEKKEILEEVPDDVRSQFKQIGFAKWGKGETYPVLFLGPYDVPPGEARDSWMKMFENTRSRRHMMPRLVYWYGTAKLEPQYAYSVIPKSTCMTYDQGVAKGHAKLPKRIQKKLDDGKVLDDFSHKDQLKIQSLKELQIDLEKKPEDRKHLDMGSFDELYELEEDDESVVVDQIDVEELEDVEEEEGPLPSAKKKGRKTQSMDVDEDVFAEVEITSEEEDEEAEVPEDGDEDDDDEMNYYEPQSKKKPKSAKKRKSETQAETKAKPSSKKAKLERKRSKKISQKTVYSREQKEFEACEDKYLDLVKDWKVALRTKRPSTVAEIMEKLTDCVDSFRASFIEAYELPLLMKRETKPLLKNNESYHKKYKEVWHKMKSAFEKNEKPSGFEPKKRTKKSKTMRPVVNESPSHLAPKSKATHPPASTDVPTTSGNDPKQDSTKEAPTLSPSRIPRTKKSSEFDPVSPPLSRETSSPLLMTSPSQTASRPNDRKAFSLSHLMRPKPEDSGESDHPGRLSPSIKEGAHLLGTPSWLTSPPVVDNSLTANEDRTFALEFFKDAASLFPPEKVNRDTVARALEMAVYKWAEEKHDNDWVEEYWTKVHSLVAAMSGKRKTGPLVNAIVNGKYTSARDLVVAPEETLRLSFGE